MADWEGAFGDEYTERNQNIPSRVNFWAKVIPPDCFSAFEIGCGSGANLSAIHLEKVSGCDVNQSAVDAAKANGLDVVKSNGLCATTRADLVFTSGVLIHLRTPELIKMMKQMRALSHLYVLFNEYYAEYDQEVPYRGAPGALYKRNFGDIYSALFPQDELKGKGHATKAQGFDDTTYWLFKRHRW